MPKVGFSHPHHHIIVIYSFFLGLDSEPLYADVHKLKAQQGGSSNANSTPSIVPFTTSITEIDEASGDANNLSEVAT